MSRKLTFDELKYVQEEIRTKGKSVGISYLLAVFFGLIGIHMAYLERRKSALIRIAFTITNATLLGLVISIALNLNNIEITTQLQQYSSILTIFLTITLVMQLSLIIYDFISIPKIVREIELKIEETSSLKLIQAGYAESAIKKNETSIEIINEVSNKCYPIIEDKIDYKVETEINKANSSIKLLQNNYDKIENLNTEIEEKLDIFENLSTKLNEKIVLMENQINNSVNDDKESTLNDENHINLSNDGDYIDIEDNEKELPSNENNESELESNKNLKDNHKDDFMDTDELILQNKDSGESVSLGLKEKGEVIVSGFIVGHMDNNGFITKEPYTSNSNIVIADKENETSLKKVLVVQLSKKSNLRNELGLKRNVNNKNIKITISGEIFDYFNTKGLKNVNLININHL